MLALYFTIIAKYSNSKNSMPTLFWCCILKLKFSDEMKNFARERVEPMFQFGTLVFLIVLHIAMVLGTICGLSFQSWIVGIAIAGSVFMFCYLLFTLLWFASKRCVNTVVPVANILCACLLFKVWLGLAI